MSRRRGERGRGTSGSGRDLVRALVLALCAVLAGGAWALASPPGSAPDDVYHLSSIWCAPGASTQDCGRVPGRPDARLLPTEVAASTCFVQDPEKSGACQNGFGGELVPAAPVTAGNWAHSYPPLFYVAMHPFVTDHLYPSVLLMRMANVVLTVLVAVLLVLLVPRRLRAVAAVPLLVTSVPLSISLLASTNPSAWTLVSAATLWVALYASFEVPGRRQQALWALAVVATLLGAGSRGDSALFCVMSVGLVLLLRLPVLLRHRAALVVAGVCVVVAAVFFLTSRQSAVVADGFGVGTAEQTSTWALTVANAQQLPVLWFGGLGFGFMGSIGWLDTLFPPVVTFLTLACWCGVVFAALRVQSRLKVLALAALALAITVYPLYMLGQSHLPVGQGFQPRYALPILVILTGVALLPGPGRPATFGRVQAVLAAVGLSLAHLIALYTQIRRYVTGSDVSGLDLDRGREWWWGGPLSAEAVWLLGSLAFAVLCLGTFQLLVDRVGPARTVTSARSRDEVDPGEDRAPEPVGAGADDRTRVGPRSS